MYRGINSIKTFHIHNNIVTSVQQPLIPPYLWNCLKYKVYVDYCIIGYIIAHGITMIGKRKYHIIYITKQEHTT